MKKVFNTHGGDTSWNDRSGQVVEVLRPLTEDEADLFDVGPMFRIRFQDGTETDAFEDELMDLPEEGGLVEDFDFEGIFSGCRGMTWEEYHRYCMEVSVRLLTALVSKVEGPFGGELSDILNEAVERIERLQNEQA